MPVTNSSTDLILASTSPRRQELLRDSGVTFRIEVQPINEEALTGEQPQAMVERLAVAKASIIADRFPSSWVIGADTTVTASGEIFGKPVDDADALRMLTILQGTTHCVWSSFALLNREKKQQYVESACTEVEMMVQSRAELEQYIATGEPMDKAGAYAIQGKGGYLIKRISGSYCNVVGLDLPALIAALRRFELVK